MTPLEPTPSELLRDPLLALSYVAVSESGQLTVTFADRTAAKSWMQRLMRQRQRQIDTLREQGLFTEADSFANYGFRLHKETVSVTDYSRSPAIVKVTAEGGAPPP